jgi:protein-disulfide isomerase
LPIFYGLLGLIALVGAIALIANLGGGGESGPFTARPLNAPVGTTAEGFYYKGKPDAPVKVVEYADFQCPSCGAFARQSEAAIDSKYVENGKIQMIYHEFPLPQHPNAIPAAEAARCAGDQGKFWPMHDLLFARQSQWENDGNVVPRLTTYATDIGLNRDTFAQCMASGKWTNAVKQAAAAAEQVGVQFTPTFAVDGKQVDASQLEATIDAALKAKGQ